MKTQLISVDKIELDPGNPRIARMLEMYDQSKLTADQIALALGAGDSQAGETYTTFYSLKESIRTNGGIIHPIIVNRKPDGRLIAIEGNTRLQIYRDFLKEGVKGKWDLIPAIVHENLDEHMIDAIRLQAHLVGPRPWDPYSKARYLNHLRNSKHMTLDQIVEFCGGRRRQVIEYVAAYQDMEQHYRPCLEPSEYFDVTRFSAFVELQRPNIQQALVAAHYNKGDFARWVKDDLLMPLNTVRQLSRILAHPAAREVFLEDGAQEAIKCLETEPEDASLAAASLTQVAQELSRRISKLGLRDIQRLKSELHGEEGESLSEAKVQLEEFFSFIAEEDIGASVISVSAHRRAA